MDHDVETPARDPRLLIVLGVLAAISAVVAGFVIFSDGPQAAPPPEATATLTATATSLQMGPANAPSQVVVVEDLASPQSRSFDIASRDFLRIEAARGSVQVEYRPFAAAGSDYSAAALQAWAGVLRAGTPQQALAFHDVLFDRQPAADAPTPSELVTWAKESGVRGDGVFEAMATADADFVAAAAQAARDAGAARTPRVLLDGTPVTAASPTDLADQLQRAVLDKDER